MNGGIKTRHRVLLNARPAKTGKILETMFCSIKGKVGTVQEKVLGRRFLGRGLVYNIQTSTGNYIANGLMSKNCQMLQNPIAGQQRMFDIKDLKIYEIRPQTLQVYVLVDPARSQKRGSDNTAIAVIGIDYAGNKYLLDGYRHKMDLTERWVRTRDMYKWWASASGVQGISVGYESYGAQADLDYFHERQRIERIPFQIEELAWPRDGEGSKVDRVQRLTPDVRNGRFYIPYHTDPKNLTKSQREMLESGQDYRIARKILHKGMREAGKVEAYDLTEDFKMEMAYFPYAGKKDLIDAVSRIFDMEPVTPGVGSNDYKEPAIP